MKKIISLMLALLISVILSNNFARSFRVAQIPNGDKFGCNTCHTNGGGTPRNAFGLTVENSFLDNNGNVIWGAELAMMDSDGDGFTNGAELLDSTGQWVTGSANPGDATLVTKPGDAESFPTTTDILDENIAITFSLDQNYPNPFNPSTKISFSIPEASVVKIKVYNILGSEIVTLVNQNLSAGKHEVPFNASNLVSGVYVYTISANNYSASKKMILMK